MEVRVMAKKIAGGMAAAAALAGFLFLPPSAEAGRIKKRAENQQDRIAQGVKSGELTPRETARLEGREARLGHEVKGMLHPGEVRLRGVGEEVVVLAADFGQVARQQLLVDAQIGRLARHVGRLGAAGARELADPVDRVVVVEAE